MTQAPTPKPAPEPAPESNTDPTPIVDTKVADLRRERGRLSKASRAGDVKAKKRINDINAEIKRYTDFGAQIADQSAADAEDAARAEARRRRGEILDANRRMQTSIDAHRSAVTRVEDAVMALVPALSDLVAASDDLWERHRGIAPQRVDALSPGIARHRLASYVSAQLGRVDVLDAERKLQNIAHATVCPALSESETEFYDRLLAPVPEVKR